MNRLKHKDSCIPKDYEEYLEIHRLFENARIDTLQPYDVRVLRGVDGYMVYPNLYWDDTPCLCGCRTGVGRHYNTLTVDEFLHKAGIKRDGKHKYNTGGPFKHKFI